VPFANVKIGTRLGLSFALCMLMMFFLIAVAIMRLSDIGEINQKIITQDWVNADASATINALTRDNARKTMELFLTADKVQSGKIYQQIDANKKIIGTALQTLEKLVDSAEGKAQLAKLGVSRVAYVTSFTRLGKMLDEGQRDEASKLLASETLPALDVLLADVKVLNEIQQRQLEATGAAARKNIDLSRNLIFSFGLLGLLCCIGFGFWLTRSITLPLNKAVRIAKTVAAGNFSSDIKVLSNDETGQLMQALKGMNENLSHTIGEVRNATGAISTAARQIAAGNMDLSGRTEAQASSLEQTAASMEQLTATVKQNAEHTRRANQLAAGASEVAVKGGKVVYQVVETMSSISDSSKKIIDIISVIEGIAFQTNILALNAAVEAARAGEQGRGFAVVATEVRNLAQRSAAAAKEIKSLIGDSAEKVDTGSKLVSEAGHTMEEIVSSIQRVTDIMGEIARASMEQSAGIAQVNQAVAHMDQTTQQNAALVEEAAAAAGSLEQQAENLLQFVSVFTLAGSQQEYTPQWRTLQAGQNRQIERRGPRRATNVVRLPSGR
jgi:methyl-accepting chemotaxis protein